MRQHLRTDAIKVYADGDKHLRTVMAHLRTKSKSDAYRMALERYVEHLPGSEVQVAIRDDLKATRVEVTELKSLVEDLYFVIRTLREDLKAGGSKP